MRGPDFRHWHRQPHERTMGDVYRSPNQEAAMLTFIAWMLLLFFCWPLALLALVLYPLVWLLMLPFRLLGLAVEGVFGFIKGIIMLPARVLGVRPG